MRKILLLSVVILIAILSAGCQLPGANPLDQTEEEVKPVGDLFDYQGIDYSEEYVLLRSDVSLEYILNKLGSSIVQEWPEISWVRATVPAGETTLSFLEKMKKRGDILLAEPDMLYQLDLAASASQYGEQWGFQNIKAEAAWDITTGDPNVIVAIIDTGVDVGHPEFTDKTFIGDYDTTTGLTGTENMHDLNGHGTHVAGIAADNGRNGQISGVAWDCPIMPVRVEDDNGSIWTSYLIEAMIYLGDYAQVYPDKRIVANMSIGGRGYNFAFKDAIDYAAENGVLLITSAGNDKKRILSYPSAYNGVVSVAASTPYDEKASFSTIGFWNSVAAPGIRILSTVPSGEYTDMQGTSMASPYVTGAAALLLSKDPTLTPLQIKNQIEQTARGEGFSEELGYGILDVEALLGPIQPMQYGSLDVTSNIISTDLTGDIGTGVITVYDANNLLVSFGTTGEYGNYLFQAMKPGNYRVNLTYYDPYKGDYSAESKTVSVNIDQEKIVNFTAPVPTQVIKTSVYSDDIGEPAGAFHEIPITIVQQGIYEFETSDYMYDCDTVLSIYDVNGNLVAYNDDYLDRYSLIRMNMPPGDYTVVVEEFSGDELYTHFEIYVVEAIY